MSEPAAGDLGFAYRRRKGVAVEVLHHGRLACVLRGVDALDFLARVESCGPLQAQHLMARITGNYKRGNERAAGQHIRNRR
ncbi:MAG: hypothetical protein IAE86_19115 [Burkholderiaceae bacterium]|nr:hypothetical protein [Burkholderiaceae bacterium]